MELALTVLMPFVFAGLAPLLAQRFSSRVVGSVMAVVMSALFVLLIGQASAVQSVGAVQFSAIWVADLSLTFSFRLDGISLIFALIVTGVGALVMLYAGYYFEDARNCGRFLMLMLGFSGAMLGLVLADNLIVLFISWELTSIISFLLISFKGKQPKARIGAMQALIITGGGGLALLLGVLLLGTAAGSFELSTILSGGSLSDHPFYLAIVICVALGAFTKSAQFPFHFWLPGAMSAPTPASAFLHSATMVKAGIYLLLRLQPALGQTPLWSNTLLAVGVITAIIGAFWAIRQRDLKGCLAFSTVSWLGMLVALIGLPNSIGIMAALVGVIAHAMYKGALFLVAGTIDHTTGTRIIDELGGLRHTMPGFAVVTAIAGLSMAGVPPLFGFVAKEVLLKAMVETPGAALQLAVVTLGAALTVTMALILFWDVFMGKFQAPDPHFHHGEGEFQEVHHPLGDDAHDADPHHHNAPLPMLLAPGILAIGSLLGGFLIDPIFKPLLESAVGGKIKLYLIPPEFDLAFQLSLTALAVGFVVFLARQWWLKLQLPRIPSGTTVFRAVIALVEKLGDFILRSQNGKVRFYLAVILLTVVTLVAISGVANVVDLSRAQVEIDSALDVLKVALLALSLTATFASVRFRQHLAAALALGVSGYAIGGLFLLEPAPDVALVQFLVETLGTVLIILILAKTRSVERAAAMEAERNASQQGRLRDAVIATAVGLGVTIFALAAVLARPTRDSIAVWHLENALPETGVNDVVAAIVTDFRGMDTLIEITVFGMAALAVLTLLTRPAADSPEIIAAAPTPPLSTPLTRFAVNIVLPFSLLIAVAHIAYAGAAPGDGFTAGVVGGLGVSAYFVVNGYTKTKRNLRWVRPLRLIGVGLSLAYINAALPLAFGREFAAITILKELSLPAALKLSSTTLFEIGIFITVMGGISAIMEAIAHPKEVELE